MDAQNEFAPAIRSILAAAERRTHPLERSLSVDSRPLPEALSDAELDGRVPVIAEVKPTSPTTEGTNTGDPVELAQEMVDGGAAALSVLTEPDHFGGSAENLRRIREAVDVPVLRKDFVLRESQLDVVESDVVLLIARFVEDLDGLLAAARERGFQVLVEVHTREELEAAVEAGADVLGINNRDLANLDVDISTFEELAPHAPDDAILVAESGISTPEDVRRMRDAGADALLIGSAIMDGDVAANTRRLVEAER